MSEVNAALAIAQRDLLRLVRDRASLLSQLIFPFVFIGALGGSLQANLGQGVGYNFVAFIFTGVLAQSLFQSTAFGLISLIEDRENDFTQEIFVSPISRYTIVLGKILGETIAAAPQALAIVGFAAVIGVPLSVTQLLGLVPAALAACLLGGSFGLVVLSFLTSQRAANRIFPFVFLPQFFLAGVMNPIRVLPWYLDVLSRISPMRYAVDLTRGVFYAADPEAARIVLQPPAVNAAVVAAMFACFVGAGTFLFVRRERNR